MIRLLACSLSLLLAACRDGSSRDAVARGQGVYVTRCAACHQADGRGMNGRLAADFVGDPSRLAKSDADLLRSIANGVPGTAMAPFKTTLDEDAQRDVLAYLRATYGAR